MSKSTPASVPKRIVICCDGTWQSSVSEEFSIPSNVTRLCRHLARSGKDESHKVWQQIVYYDSGVGTGSLRDVEKKRQGATGDGLSVNVIEAYNFIVMNYNPGDEIFCFGFSRGAYTARAVAGLVTDIGVLEPRQMQIFPDLYHLYKQNTDSDKLFTESQVWLNFVEGKLGDEERKNPISGWRKEQLEDFKKEWRLQADRREISRNVKVVGVWDTVGSLGIPDLRWTSFSGNRARYAFHNVKLNEYIEHAFQALALDERRQAFQPTLWYLPKPSGKPKKAKKPSELLQVWFPGVHINIGGGSDDLLNKAEGDHEQMAYITWAWMLQCVSPYLAFDEHGIEETMKEHAKLLDQIAKCSDHHSPKGWVETAWSYVPSVPFLGSVTKHEHKVDRGWGTGNFVDSFSGIMAWTNPVVRKPGECSTEKLKIDESGNRSFDTIPLAKLDDFGTTNEQIHPVAAFRKERYDNTLKGDLCCHGLKGWKREEEREDGRVIRYKWYKVEGKKRIELPEYLIAKSNRRTNYERLMMAVDGNSVEEEEFLDKIDKAVGH
ncbi:hypothetical protein AOQ84DRAFT_303965 [Glonium stellatum]|uniref:T6SS Phospholipase effector Tle1-like catalytic domain-containing protein n=1 Tax=Glonium stellatum TaxID=574774 RepID=A0A8E2JMG2_9PEZI|nr:hypothetical protein AOQ84DRAFT_303965 [Glonium stellatum]